MLDLTVYPAWLDVKLPGAWFLKTNLSEISHYRNAAKARPLHHVRSVVNWIIWRSSRRRLLRVWWLWPDYRPFSCVYCRHYVISDSRTRENTDLILINNSFFSHLCLTSSYRLHQMMNFNEFYSRLKGRLLNITSRSMTQDLWLLIYNSWSMTSDLSFPVYIWLLINDSHFLTPGLWIPIYDLRLMTCDLWLQIYDSRSMNCNRWLDLWLNN